MCLIAVRERGDDERLRATNIVKEMGGILTFPIPNGNRKRNVDPALIPLIHKMKQDPRFGCFSLIFHKFVSFLPKHDFQLFDDLFGKIVVKGSLDVFFESDFVFTEFVEGDRVGDGV